MLSRSTFIRRLISTTKKPREGEDAFVVDGINLDEDVVLQQGHSHSNYHLRPGTPLPPGPKLRPRSRSSTSQHEETGAVGQLQPARPHTSSPPQKGRLWVPRSRAAATSVEASKKSQVSGSIFSPRPHIVQRGTSPVPQLPDGTPHSSASSLCSCECHADGIATPPPPSKSPRLCLFPPDEQRPRSASVPRPSVRTPSPCPSTKELNEESQTSTLNLLEALSLEPHDAAKQPKKTKAKKGTCSPKKVADDQTVVGWSENVQQLIRETDEAFKAVGSALAEAKMASQSFGEPFPSERHRTPPPVPNMAPALSSTFPGPHYSLPPIPQPPRSPNTFPKRSNSKRSPKTANHNSPTRSRSKRKSPKTSKKPLSPQNSTKRKATHPLSASKHNLRWTLTENVAELLNAAGSKLFNRIEADEMLTPQQIQELKKIRQQRLAEAEATERGENFPESPASSTPRNSSQSDINCADNETSTASTTTTPSTTPALAPISTASTAASSISINSDARRESIATINSIESEDESETPVDSFHLSDLPSRISASEVRFLSPSSPTEPFSLSFKGFGIEDDGDIVRKDFSIGEKKRPQPLTLDQETKLDEDDLQTPRANSKGDVKECMIFESLKFPSPPLRSPGRSPKGKLPALPTIPEVTVTPADEMPSPPTPHPSAQNQQRKTVPYLSHVVENETYIFLQSSPYSVTQPTIRHGPIRFDKAELRRNLQLHALSNRSSIQEGEPQFAEETLDWTAFQMALMGGAGDVFWNVRNDAESEMEDEEDRTERENREEFEDEIRDWWADLGMGEANTLEGAGRLLAEDDETDVEYLKWTNFDEEEEEEEEENYPVGSGFGTPVTEYSPVSLGETPDLPQQDDSSATAVGKMPEMQERVHMQGSPFMPPPGTPGTFKNFSSTFDPERYFAGPGLGLKRWSGEGHPKRRSPLGGDRYQAPPPPSSSRPSDLVVGKEGQNIEENDGGELAAKTTTLLRPGQMSADTLPPSPMGVIRVTRRPDGMPEVSVPMGYNLGHDLGDFLKWEAEHAYAGGYYGPD